MTLADLIAMWSAQGFNDDPPNAALAVTSGGVTSQHVVELTDPQVMDRTVVLHATELDETANATVAGRTHVDEVRPGSYFSAELFIDDATYFPCMSSVASFVPACILTSATITFVHVRESLVRFCSDDQSLQAGEVVVEWTLEAQDPILPVVVSCSSDSGSEFPGNTADSAQTIQGPAGVVVSQLLTPNGPSNPYNTVG